MIWLTWRQHRAAFAVIAAVLVTFVVWMLIVQHDYRIPPHVAVNTCPSGSSNDSGIVCPVAIPIGQIWALEQADTIRLLLLGLPLVFGALRGAPLFAGEIERKTIILALSQGISRMRWTVIRLLVAALAVAVLASAMTVLVNWWYGRVPTSGGSFAERMLPGGFDVTGIVPVAYALFAFALGAALGLVFRRTAPAVLGTVVGTITVRLLFGLFLRPHLMVPIFVPDPTISGTSAANAEFPGNSALGSIGAAVPGVSREMASKLPWTVAYGSRVVPGSGHSNSQAYINHVFSQCTQTNLPNLTNCIASHRVQFGSYIQPASRYWILQWYEGAAFAAGAVALFAFTVWAVRRWQA